MGQEYTKKKLSGSTDGKRILVSGTNTGAANTIHTATAVSGADTYDEIYISAHNNDTADVKLTIEWGDTVAGTDTIEQTIKGEDGLVYVVAGELLQNGAVVKAFAGTTNKITIGGFVNRIVE